MTPPPLSLLLNELFNIAHAKYRIENQFWMNLSVRLSCRFDLVTALSNIKQIGDLDILLRCLEDESTVNTNTPKIDFSLSYQMIFSETWVISCYEILRTFIQRDKEALKSGQLPSGICELEEFKSAFNDFELLRIPIAKSEIAKDKTLEQPLPMRRVGDDETKPLEAYDRNDPNRFHIMPRSVSARGSAMWLALDVRSLQERWVERRDLSDRLLALVKLVEDDSELKTEQKSFHATADSDSPTNEE